MEVTQTVEQFLFEQLEKAAPGKYTLANVLQLFKAKLRFACTHLKGGGRRASIQGPGKDYNLSIFIFPTGVMEIKCLYNCGLKIRSDEKDLIAAFNELYHLPTTNRPASAEHIFHIKDGKRVPIDPGPAPVYSDEYRQHIRKSTDMFWNSIKFGLFTGSIKPNDPILGAVLPHPDPIEAPDSQIERGMAQAYARVKGKPTLTPAYVVMRDSVPSFEPVKTQNKIRKARKTQSRKRGK